MNAPMVEHRAGEIERTIETRASNPFIPPETWKRPEFNKFSLGTLQAPRQDSPVVVTGKDIFGGRPVEIKLLPNRFGGQTFGVPGRGPWHAQLDWVTAARHNIRVGAVGVTEHPLAFLSGLGVGGEWQLSRPCFAGSPRVMRQLADDFLRGCAPVEQTMPAAHREKKMRTLEPHVTRTPILLKFPSGAYVLYQPPRNDQERDALTVDLQFDHRSNALGAQRITATITPAFFAYIVAARSPSYGALGSLLQHCALGRGGKVPFTGFFKDNFVLVGKESLLNPDSAFDDAQGVNREVLCHEVIDKLGALALLMGLQRRLVGTLYFNRTSHGDDVAAFRALERHLVPLDTPSRHAKQNAG